MTGRDRPWRGRTGRRRADRAHMPPERAAPATGAGDAAAFPVWKAVLVSMLIFGGWQVAYHLAFMGDMPAKGMLGAHLTDLLAQTCGALLVTAYFGRVMHRQNARLRAVDRQKNLLTDAIVNSLREPLSGMRLSLSGMKSGGAPEDRVSEAMKRMVDIALDSSATLIETVNDLLDVLWLEESKRVLKLEPVYAEDFIRDGILAVKPLAGARGIRIKNSLPPGLPCLMGDAARLGRVVAHLVNNAVRHSRDGSSVLVAAARDAARGRLTVTVSDSGPGLPPGSRDRLFEWSPRAAGRRRTGVSAGLGLHFCRLVIEGHGGEIALGNAAGKGAVFAFTIPG